MKSGAAWVVFLLLVIVSPWALAAEEVEAGGLHLSTTAEGSELRLGSGPVFHQTTREIRAARLVEVPESALRVALWSEMTEHGQALPFFAVAPDGQQMGRGRQTSYGLKMLHGEFDPLVASPVVDPTLVAGEESNLYIVQFVSQPLEEYRAAIRGLGGRVHGFLASNAHIVEMTAEVRQQVAAQTFVRWVGPFHPSYRLERYLLDNRAQAERLFAKQRYNILVFEGRADAKQTVGRRIEAIGGVVDTPSSGKNLLDATLTPAQLFEVIRWDEVLFVDRWSEFEKDMDVVREIGGTNHLETVAGYTGVGVRGESFDTGFNLNHPDFASRPLIEHGGTVVNDSHGTATVGVLFGDGTGDPKALGLMPDGQGIVTYYNNIGLTGNDRYTHTGELLQAPYFAVFQTASVGSARTTEYTTISADHDTLLFDWDIVHCQSQSNAGNQNSRPQAWAKNVVSGGAFNHYDTLSKDDDCWCNTGSIGPAADGRIKPDLSFFYDDTWTTYSSGDGYGQFGGTSGATPTICGHFGLFFQMWSDGIFGNEVDAGATVFENRPHMTTAKAFMINTATQYAFTGQTHDMTRVHQGWGVPNVQTLYEMRDNISFIDESVVLANMESVEYQVAVAAGEPALRVTMTYADPAGNPASTQHRINDLTLKLTSPSATVYWGNHGLLDGNWSIPGGAANTIDTVENIFVENPEEGTWIIEITASEINQDGHVETPETDADFALVVSGGFMSTCTSEGRISLGGTKLACEDQADLRVVDCDLNTDDETVETVTVTITSDSEPAGESVVLTETGAGTAIFKNSLPVSTTDGPGVLLVGEGDTVTATYVDADDGMGGTNLSRSADATVDCSGPVISGVQSTGVTARVSTIEFTTDEQARGTVRYGLSCAGLTLSETGSLYTSSHSIRLSGLAELTTYYYVVDAEDLVANASTDDNGGACYEFTTPAIPVYFTELFSNDNDMDLRTTTFTPNGSVDFYSGCTEVISEFPTDPAGGTEISLTDDSSQEVTLTGGASVSLYGVSYTSFYVGSNGFLTFTVGDSDTSESFADHFDTPRISALFDDLNPATGGTVSWKQLADRAVVTWDDVPEYNQTNINDLQVELFFDGTITISLLNVDATDGLTGLSEGNGQDALFEETDLSALQTCTVGTAPGEAGAGPQLLVTGYDKGTGAMAISYGVPCQATDHAIEYGALQRVDLESYNWAGQECGVGTSGTANWLTAGLPESLFFVIVANDGSDEGSYGTSSAGLERGEDTTSTTCPMTQNLAEACD